MENKTSFVCVNCKTTHFCKKITLETKLAKHETLLCPKCKRLISLAAATKKSAENKLRDFTTEFGDHVAFVSDVTACHKSSKRRFICENCKTTFTNDVGIVLSKLKRDGRILCGKCMRTLVLLPDHPSILAHNAHPKDIVECICESCGDHYHRVRKSAYSEKFKKVLCKDCRATARAIYLNSLRKGTTFEEFYGQEKAKVIKEKFSLRMRGKNNHMYGKPSPNGSGNGWSGHYGSFYFRSLLELSFLIVEKSIAFSF